MSKRNTKFVRIFLVLAILALGAGIYAYIHRGEVSTDDAMIDGRAVTLSPKVAGYVKTLNIDDNQPVKAGDILLEIDPIDYQIRRDHAAAALEAAQAQLASNAASLDKAQSDLARMHRLGNDARSQEQLEQATAAEKIAQADNGKLQAQVKQAQADLAQADQDLANTKIIAAMDGHIARRGVERGDYVQPGQALASLVGAQIWVIADFKETQLRDLRIGQPVDIRIDAFPDVKLQGKIDSVQSGTGSYFSAFPAENASGNFVKIVQRVPVKITFDTPPDAKLNLGPGMSVTPTVNPIK